MMIIRLLIAGKCYYPADNPCYEPILEAFYGVLALAFMNLPFCRDHTVHPLP